MQVRAAEMTVGQRNEPPNEYEDLLEATDRQQSSLEGNQSGDEGHAKELGIGLERVLSEQLFGMLSGYIQPEDDPDCAQFVPIKADFDPDVVEQKRELITLES
jgi:hypothetical protein